MEPFYTIAENMMAKVGVARLKQFLSTEKVRQGKAKGRVKVYTLAEIDIFAGGGGIQNS